MLCQLILKSRNVISKLSSTGFFHIFSSTILVKIIAFLSSIILVRILSKSEFGIYSYSNNILNLILILSGLGTVSGILQLCSEYKDEKLKAVVYKYGSTVGTLFNSCLCIVVLLIGLFIPLPFSGANNLLLFMCITPLINSLNDYQSIYLRVSLKNKKYAYNNMINSILLLAFSIAGAFLLQTEGLVIFQNIAKMVGFLIALYLLKIPLSFGKSYLDKDLKKLMISISLISMLNNGLSSLLNVLDVFIIGIIIPDEKLIASYTVALIIPTALSFIPMAVITYIYPYFARNKDDKSWVLVNFKKVLLGIGIVNFCITSFFIVFAPFIVSLLFGGEYADKNTVECFRILSLGYFFSGTFRIISGNLLVTQRRLKYNLFVAILSGVLTIICDIILILALSAVGAAIAKLIIILLTSILNTGYMFYILRQRAKKTAT